MTTKRSRPELEKRTSGHGKGKARHALINVNVSGVTDPVVLTGLVAAHLAPETGGQGSSFHAAWAAKSEGQDLYRDRHGRGIVLSRKNLLPP